MDGMFEYLEWNNLDFIFHKNAKNCKHFVDNSDKIEDLLAKIKVAKYQMKWIKDYVTNINEERSFEHTVNTLREVTEKYLKALNK